jgi:hypothetical protein
MCLSILGINPGSELTELLSSTSMSICSACSGLVANIYGIDCNRLQLELPVKRMDATELRCHSLIAFGQPMTETRSEQCALCSWMTPNRP